MGNNYDPTDEWTDDRPEQDTLGTEDPTQYRESRTDEGSEEFADDRDVYDPTTDAGEQASLTPETVGDGQQSLTGGEAEEPTEWDDPDEFEAPPTIHGFERRDDGMAYEDTSDLERGRYSLTYDETGPGAGGKALIQHELANVNATEEYREGMESLTEAKRFFVGWMRDTFNDPPGAGDQDDDEDGEIFDGEERGRIKHHAEHGNLATMLRVAGVPDMTARELIDAEGWESAGDVLDHAGEFDDLDGIGPSRAEKLDAAVPHIEEVAGPDDGDEDLEAMAETAKEMKVERKRPIPDAEREGVVYQGVDRREIPDSGLSLSDITDWPYINREEGDPEDRERHQEIMSNVYDPTDEESTDTDDQADAAPFDPTTLFSDDVVEEMDASVEWQDVEHPEKVPESEREAEVDLAERILSAGGNRTGFGHHEEVRRSMTEWAPDRDEDAPDDPGYWREMAYSMTPSERNMGRLEGDPEERYKKARTVIAWASDTIDPDVLREIEQEQADDATDAWMSEAEDTANRKAAEKFHSDPPDTFNGWERFDPQGKPDVRVAYKGENHGTPSAAFVYGSGDDVDAQESVLEEFEDADSAADAPMNRPISRVASDTTVWEDLKSHLTTFDAEPVTPGENEQHDGGDDQDQDDEPPAEQRRGEPVEFGTLDAANDFRDTVGDDHLHPDDTRRTKTVTLHPDAPQDLVDDAEDAALRSKADQTKSYGQTKLSEGEREQLKRTRETWTWGRYGFEAMSAKAALQAEGATDWTNYYEAGEGVQGSLKNLEAGKEASARSGAPNAIKGDYVDSDPDPGEMARMADKAHGQNESRAIEGCEEGEPLACDELLDRYGYTEQEVEQIKAAAEEIGEDPVEIYDPTTDTDTGQSFEEWAAANEPEASEPADAELAKLAPVDAPEELPGPALRALKKAWSGYKLARVEHRKAEQDAERYASVINGIRAVNGQDPLTFEAMDGWTGGEVMPDDPTEEFPAPEGGQETMAEAAEHGHASSAVQSTINKFRQIAGSDPYDPTEEM